MSENHSAPRRRSRRSEQAQHLYTARAAYPVQEEDAWQPESLPGYEPEAVQAAAAQPQWDGYAANEETYDGYTPNEETYAGYTPNEPETLPDYAAYYSREGASAQEDAQPAFAPPPKMDYYGYESQIQTEAPQEDYLPNNVYRPRQATWADEAREEVLAQSDLGYQVSEDALPERKRRKLRHTLRNLLVTLILLALIGGAAYFFREPIMAWLQQEEILPTPTPEVFEVVVTPEPIKAYDAAQPSDIADGTQTAITNISAGVRMENFIVTENSVVTRSRRADGSYDFYLFTAADGRLLCYFEGLGPYDMIPQEGGSLYVAQEPYLVGANGSALIRTSDLEAALGEEVKLHPLYRGWAVVESLEDGSANYISTAGQVLSTLWFSRTFPFTGEHTVAYVDTGATADPNQRYLLYVLGADGMMSRWLATDDMLDVTASACSMAYMNNGDLYQLPDTSAPILNTPEVRAYLDCDALVVKDAQTGKYGLFVRGEQHYDFAYDSIQPVESDIVWAEKTLRGEGGSFTVLAVAEESYPLPLSHSFVLEKNGQREYVALSTESSYPIRLDGEF